MKIMIDRKSAHQYASQGQQRTIVLSIKIALLELIKYMWKWKEKNRNR